MLIIEHNLDVIKVSDYVIDMGPEGGSAGGNIVAQGTPEVVAKSKVSITAPFLAADLAGSAVAQPAFVPPPAKQARLAKVVKARKLTKAEQVLEDAKARTTLAEAAADALKQKPKAKAKAKPKQAANTSTTTGAPINAASTKPKTKAKAITKASKAKPAK